MKKLLVFSHAGVLDVNRAIFQSIANHEYADVTMVVPSHWQGDLIRKLTFKKTVNDKNLKLYPLRPLVSGNGSLFFYASFLRSALKSVKPDFVFVDEEPWSLAAFQIFQAMDQAACGFYTKQNLKKKVPPPFFQIQKHIFNQSQCAFSVADEVSEVLRWKGYSGPIHYLPHSYDPQLFRLLSNQGKSATKNKLGISQNALVIGYFGRLTEEKGIDELLEVMKRVSRDFDSKEVCFLWVGNGPMETKVRNDVNGLGSNVAVIHSAIPHHEVGQALGVVDILVLPSRTKKFWKEQFGRILVEAMACGAAVLGSDSGEIPHLIQRSGGGLIFKEGNVDDLEAKLRSLILDRKRLNDFKNEGGNYVRKTLTHDSVAKDLAEKIFSNS